MHPHPRSLSHWERDDPDEIVVWVRANVTMKRPCLALDEDSVLADLL